jgi:hypothetical protein
MKNRIVSFIIAKDRKQKKSLNVLSPAENIYQYCWSKMDMCRKLYNLRKTHNSVKVYLDASTEI